MSKIVLSEEQQVAATTLDGPVEVISCPGSGKTTLIVERAHNLIEKGTDGRRILVITFATLAARQMRERYVARYGDDKINFSTMHSLCYCILKEEKHIGKDNILDEGKKIDCIKKILESIGERKNINKLAEDVIADISFCKNTQMPYREYETRNCDKKVFKSVYSKYEEHKKPLMLFDFDDLLTEVNKIFSKSEATLKKYQGRFTHIMIDEFQDTNSLQADIFYKLADSHKNICVVGDDDQSIYRFRAAEPKIMLDFKEYFKETKVCYMSTNYRSCRSIVNCGKTLIDNNKVRFDKNFLASKQEEGSVQIYEVDSFKEQARKIVTKIEALHQGRDIPYEDMAILYRTRSENSFIAGELALRGVPFESKDVIFDYHNSLFFKIIEAYYYLSQGQGGPAALKFILNFPNRFLKADLFKDCPLDKDMLIERAKKAKNSGAAVENVLLMLANIKALSNLMPKDFVNKLLNGMGLKKHLLDFAEYTHMDKDMLKQTIDLIQNEAQGFVSMQEWIDYATECRENIEAMKKTEDGVHLTTMHGSKGLEYRVVFIINCNEGYIPAEKSLYSDEDIEEERRLLYVGITRAKELLYLYTLAESPGKERSRFIDEIGKRIQKAA